MIAFYRVALSGIAFYRKGTDGRLADCESTVFTIAQRYVFLMKRAQTDAHHLPAVILHPDKDSREGLCRSEIACTGESFYTSSTRVWYPERWTDREPGRGEGLLQLFSSTFLTGCGSGRVRAFS